MPSALSTKNCRSSSKDRYNAIVLATMITNPELLWVLNLDTDINIFPFKML